MGYELAGHQAYLEAPYEAMARAQDAADRDAETAPEREAYLLSALMNCADFRSDAIADDGCEGLYEAKSPEAMWEAMEKIVKGYADYRVALLLSGHERVAMAFRGVTDRASALGELVRRYQAVAP
jgi:hypothetical protein